MDKPYCVIGKNANFQFERQWYMFQDSAVDHAKDLVRSNGNKDIELYVVKVIAVVKKAIPPIEVIFTS